MNHGKNVGFNFSRHGAGDVENFTTVVRRLS